MTQSLKVAVMGAGAVGCYFGGMLARAGHQVVLVARPQHVAAIERDGLRMETRNFDEHVRLAASSDPAAVKGADLVLFCVKSTDTESAGALIRPHLAPNALVLCLQNGVDNADRLRAVLPQHAVAAAVVYVATEMAGLGYVKHHGRGDLVLDDSEASAATAEMFRAAGVPVVLSGEVREALWGKLIINCAYNALSAVSQITYGPLMQISGVREVITDVVAECVAVGRAAGVALKDPDLDAIFGIAGAMPAQYSSTAQDMAREKPTEIDYLNGFIVRKGEALGVPTPANRVLHVMVKLLESKYASKPAGS